MPESDIDSLNAAHAISGRVLFETQFCGPVAALTSPTGSRAVIAIQGAQLLSFVAKPGDADVLWLSPVARLGTGKAVRGGVPVCWPWFGPHPTDSTAPAHGLVRAKPWHVASAASDSARTSITFRTECTPNDHATWPNAARLELTVTIGVAVDIVLRTINSTHSAWSLTEALHSYIRVGDIAVVEASGLSGTRYLDQLTGQITSDAADAITIGTEFDRIYVDSVASVAVIDQSLKRCITVSKSSSQSTVVWNPWIEKGVRLGDLGDDGHRHFLCVETANALHNAIQISPGETHVMTTRIAVEHT
jgi:glucose-6-phosphate 1-epimerase